MATLFGRGLCELPRWKPSGRVVDLEHQHYTRVHDVQVELRDPATVFALSTDPATESAPAFHVLVDVGGAGAFRVLATVDQCGEYNYAVAQELVRLLREAQAHTPMPFGPATSETPFYQPEHRP